VIAFGRARSIAGEGTFVSSELLVAVVDDDEAFRTAMVESLDSLGYVARAFASAEEFIASGTKKTCKCVITDIHMPGMGGFELLQLLVSGTARLPVIMITARGEPGLEAKATDAGAVCLLRKPFDSNLLIGCLDKALGSK
jgi:FixJ family two-component response regulator